MKGETPKKVKKQKEKIKKEKKKKEKTNKEKTNEQVEPEIKTREVTAETKYTSKNYLERISAKYEVPEKRIKEADEYVRKHFIDSGFAKYYRAAHSAPVSMITKSGTKTTPIAIESL